MQQRPTRKKEMWILRVISSRPRIKVGIIYGTEVCICWGEQEGLNAGVYLKRPSFEKDPCTGVTWKKSHPAALQFPSGHPDDGMFSDKPDFVRLSVDEHGDRIGDPK